MDERLNDGFICEKHQIGYISECPTCAGLKKELLEEIKELNKSMNDDYFKHNDRRAKQKLELIFERNYIDWLIEQAERAQELESELAREFNVHKAIEHMLSAQNKRYREAVERIKIKIKSHDERLEKLKEPHYHDESGKINRLNGEALGMEIALKIINETLEESE